MIKESFNGQDCLSVDSYGGLLVDYAKMKNAVALIRGMRAISDFENEFQIALMNRKLSKDVQSVFLMTGLRWIFTSSSIIKEVAMFGAQELEANHAIVKACANQEELLADTLAFARTFTKQRGIFGVLKSRMHKDTVHIMDSEDKEFIDTLQLFVA